MSIEYGVNWDNLLTFKEVYPNSTDFAVFVQSITEEAVLFDVTKLYDAMTETFEFDKLKHASRSGFNNDFRKIWNSNIHRLNREFELLNENYSEDVGVVVETEQAGSLEITGEAEQTIYDKPQFDDLEKNPTGHNSGTSGSNQDTTNTGKSTTKQANKNAQINEYLQDYKRFVYTEVIRLFSGMFLNVIG